MKFYKGLLAALTCAIVIAIVQTRIAIALAPEQINQIAKEITVLIDGQYPGSGVIVARQGNTYYVLTAAHVVATEDKYEVVTPDGERYAVSYSIVKKLSGVDLAVLEFTSNKNYSIARLGNSNQLSEGSTVYISGWANPGREILQRVRQFTSGQVSALSPTPLADGYALVYTNITRAGMSGGAVLNDKGHLVGVHGRAEGDAVFGDRPEIAINVKVGFNLGIPIKTFVNYVKKAGIQLELHSVESASELAKPSSFSDGSTSTRPPVISGSEGAVPLVCPGRRC